MDAILVPVAGSSRLPRYLAELKELLAREAVERARFRDWLTPDTKAEFINGDIVVHSPAKFRHNDARSLIEKLLSLYVHKHALGVVQSEKALIEFTRNDYEPDVCFWRSSKSNAFHPDQAIFPPPDMAVEVLSPSTEPRDRGEKFDDYASHGVEEYWIVDPVGRRVEQYLLNGETFHLRATLGIGDTLASVAVQDFTANVSAFFDTDQNYRAIVDLTR